MDVPAQQAGDPDLSPVFPEPFFFCLRAAVGPQQ